MPVAFVGLVSPRDGSEIRPSAGPGFDTAYIDRMAQVHERADFDRCLIGQFSNLADGFLTAARAFSVTTRLGMMLAHRPGFMAPTLAARKLATLDQLSNGRLVVHIITGGEDADQQRDGDFLPKDDRYRRTDEYLTVMRKVWTEPRPFDFEGEFYRVKGAHSDVRCFQQPHIPIYFGGSSDAAIAVGGKHADLHAIWGEPLEAVRGEMAKMRAAAAAHGRSITFSVSSRPILGRTEDEAWEKAYRILEIVQSRRGGILPPPPGSTGGQRLIAAAERGEILDKRLWTPLARLTGARGNSTALVGTPEQVADSMLDYYDIGVHTFVIRGYDPLPDAEAYGEVIQIVRRKVAERERAGASASRLG